MEPSKRIQDPEGSGWGPSHIMKELVVLYSCWGMWFEWLWELKLSDFLCNRNLNPQVCRSDFSDTAHVTWLPPDVCFHALRKRNGLNNPHGPTVEKILVMVLLSAFPSKT